MRHKRQKKHRKKTVDIPVINPTDKVKWDDIDNQEQGESKAKLLRDIENKGWEDIKCIFLLQEG